MRFYENWSVLKRILFCLEIYAALGVLSLCVLFFLGEPTIAKLAAWLIVPFIANSAFLFWAVLLPLREMKRQYVHFNHGYEPRAIFNRGLHFIPEEKQALQKIGHLLDNQEVNRLSNRQAQYLALQNQINPHFLYNTLEAIRGDALSEGMVGVANVTEALATFFRYTISNMDNLVSLEEELNNAENYFAIQNYRFGDRIGMQVEFEPGSEISRDFKVPKLTLQPIIENAIIHGLENQVGPGKVSIHIATDGQRLLIDVRDDGTGMPESVLDAINHRLNSPETTGGLEEKARAGGIALLNVDHRIKILFGEQYGLRVSSILGLGTRVEIVLPVKPGPSH